MNIAQLDLISSMLACYGAYCEICNCLWSLCGFACCLKFMLLLCRLTASLKKRLMSAYNLDKVAAIQWGVNHEPTAIDLYKRLGAEVKETGNMHIMFIENILLF